MMPLGPGNRKHLETNDGSEASAVTTPSTAGKLRLVRIVARPSHHYGDKA